MKLVILFFRFSWGKAYGRIAEMYSLLSKFIAGYTFTSDSLFELRESMTTEDKEASISPIDMGLYWMNGKDEQRLCVILC